MDVLREERKSGKLGRVLMDIKEATLFALDLEIAKGSSEILDVEVSDKNMKIGLEVALALSCLETKRAKRKREAEDGRCEKYDYCKKVYCMQKHSSRRDEDVRYKTILHSNKNGVILYKSTMCNGGCLLKSVCTFAHSEEELLCGPYINGGHCSKGKHCDRQHVRDPLIERVKRVMRLNIIKN